MNEIQSILDRAQAEIGAVEHDTILSLLFFSVVALLLALRANRVRHPARSLLSALAIAAASWIVVPLLVGGIPVLWVRTGGDEVQAMGLFIATFVMGFWGFGRWLRSEPRSPWRALPWRPASAAAPDPAALTTLEPFAEPDSKTEGQAELVFLRSEVERLRIELFVERRLREAGRGEHERTLEPPNPGAPE